MKQVYSNKIALILSTEVSIVNHPTTIFTDDDVEVNLFDTEEELNYHIARLDPSILPELPDQKEWVQEGLYQYGNLIVECIQAHNRMHYTPEETPALFNIIQPISDGYPVWVQPTGAHNAYNIGDRVYFPTENDSIYESLINANTWSPTDYPQGWQLIN